MHNLEDHMFKTTGWLILLAFLASCENNSSFRGSAARKSAEIPPEEPPKTEYQLPGIADAKGCTEIKFVNIVMILDNSRSQMETDPGNVRALAASELVSKLENISPSLEPSHAFAAAIRLAPKLKSSDIIIVNSCGDSLKDKDIIKKRLGSYTR